MSVVNFTSSFNAIKILFNRRSYLVSSWRSGQKPLSSALICRSIGPGCIRGILMQAGRQIKN